VSILFIETLGVDCREQLVLEGANRDIAPTVEHELAFVWPCKQRYPRDSQQLEMAVREYQTAAQERILEISVAVSAALKQAWQEHSGAPPSYQAPVSHQLRSC
jgi:hypothetical protein